MSDNRRNNHRWPELHTHSGALRSPRGELPAQIIDQSAEGFGIVVEQALPVRPGERLWLKSSLGVTEAEVAYSTSHGDVTRLGLRRLHDFHTDEYSGLRWVLGWGPTPHSASWQPAPHSVKIAVWGLCLCSMLTLAVYMYTTQPAVKILLHNLTRQW